MLRLAVSGAVSIGLLMLTPDAVPTAEACGVKLVVKDKKRPKKRVAAKSQRTVVKAGGSKDKRTRVSGKTKRKPVAAGRVQARSAPAKRPAKARTAPAPKPEPTVAAVEPESDADDLELEETPAEEPRRVATRRKRRAESRPAPRSPVEPIEVEIYFDTAGAQVDDSDAGSLEEVVAWLEENPRGRLIIEGHTDPVGRASYNRRLSKTRALQVKAFLREKTGVRNARLKVRPFGEERLRYDADDAKNRRVLVRSR